jgi:hypothetical protein
MRKQKYRITYITQTNVNNILFNSAVINENPLVWITKQNLDDNVTYSLIEWEMLPESLPPHFRAVITYVTQSNIDNFKFTTEKINRHPLDWIDDKNVTSQGKIKYTLINWWKT